MRITLVVILLAVVSLSAPGRHGTFVVALAREQTVTPEASGAVPIDVKWAVTQGGFFLLILGILWSYRRDFFRKQDGVQSELKREREDTAELKQVLRENAAANQAHAISVTRNTDAMHENTAQLRVLAERRLGERS